MSLLGDVYHHKSTSGSMGIEWIVQLLLNVCKYWSYPTSSCHHQFKGWVKCIDLGCPRGPTNKWNIFDNEVFSTLYNVRKCSSNKQDEDKRVRDLKVVRDLNPQVKFWYQRSPNNRLVVSVIYPSTTLEIAHFLNEYITY